MRRQQLFLVLITMSSWSRTPSQIDSSFWSWHNVVANSKMSSAYRTTNEPKIDEHDFARSSTYFRMLIHSGAEHDEETGLYIGYVVFYLWKYLCLNTRRVALTRRNDTGPPWSVTDDDRRQTNDDDRQRRQTPASITIVWPTYSMCGRASSSYYGCNF